MTTEREYIEQVQDHLAGGKKCLLAVMKINQDAGRLAASNAAMKCHGKLVTLHAEMMEELRNNWPEEFADGVQTRGGGDR